MERPFGNVDQVRTGKGTPSALIVTVGTGVPTVKVSVKPAVIEAV